MEGAKCDMKDQFPIGLRLTFWLSVIGGLGFGLTSIAVPDLVAKLSGLPGQDLPVYQQTGGAILGFTVGSWLCLRASKWEQVRIPMTGLLTFSVLSALGAFYYVVLKGVVTSALVIVLIYSILLSAGLGYYLLKFRNSKEG
jgi:hypothetical protein